MNDMLQKKKINQNILQTHETHYFIIVFNMNIKLNIDKI